MTPVTPSTTITVPDVGLVVLAGAPGSGKSTFARAHFAPGEVFSSDAFRALVSGDASDQGASADAFAAMGAIVSARAKRGLFTVVDATNSSRADRAQWAQVAKEHHVPATLVIIDVPVGVALDRVTAR
ncbi:MAG TPA: AAA family ATPase, partial [Actinomycetales bacterium]|nr:AAA family ATPase [Actinomycetales bacterium]